MGNCLSSPTDVKQRRGADAARARAWKATGIITLPPGAKELPPAAIDDPAVAAAARVLDATGARLAALPEEVSRLKGLGRLVAPDNQLTAVPAGLSALGALRVLTLDGNRLTELPPSSDFWRGLRRLESLSVARNALAALPAALGELGALRTLCVAGNKLSALPAELSECALLEALDASRNPQLAGVPAALGRLTKLAELRLDDCAVAAVPAEVLRGCVALQTLSLHGCPITADALAATDGYEAFEARRRGKYSKVIAGGAMLNAAGLDDGVDRQLAPRSPTPVAAASPEGGRGGGASRPASAASTGSSGGGGARRW